MGQFSVEKPVAPGSVLSGNQHIAREEVAGAEQEFVHVTFDDNDMILKVPVAKAVAQGLRKIASSKRQSM